MILPAIGLAHLIRGRGEVGLGVGLGSGLGSGLGLGLGLGLVGGGSTCTAASASTRLGSSCSKPSSCPHCCHVLEPQVNSSPSAVIAAEQAPPHATLVTTTPCRATTRRGTGSLPLVPWPNLP